ncbi:hypothetical protein Mal64_05230 [Pseudobythopirellula maris]|uniref:DUF3352 domain-containing protein n=1 Tax=Pseudobythopirellula maris TaxID=2527991 RepID=A0A5C5ZRJ9_9BACT|nr:hypothetical protein [Pseudobythopirellula maris]TWT90139.1 hypothetical protein Mal64_05230 [Pseudobythopirellula maris]
MPAARSLPTPSRLATALLTAALAMGALAPRALAQSGERPTAMRLFPAETVLFFRTADAGELVEKIKASSMGQFFQDPEVTPFFGDLYGSAADAYSEKAEEEVGASLGELFDLIQGEIAVGMVARRNEHPAIAVLADLRDRMPTVDALLERIEEASIAGGGSVTREELRGEEVLVFRKGDDTGRMVGVVRRGGVLVASTDSNILTSMLARWDGVDLAALADQAEETAEAGTRRRREQFTESLAENRGFSDSLAECVEGQSEPPHAIVFADPVGIVKAMAQKNTGLRFALATFPLLGLDKIEGASMASWYKVDSWESLVRGHLLVAAPRSGILKILRLEPCDTTPPNFISDQIETCITFRLDPERIFSQAAQLSDKIRGEGQFREMVDKNFSGKIGADLENEILPQLTGRVVWWTSYGATSGHESRYPGGRNSVALELTDPEAARALLERMIEPHLEHFEDREMGGVDYRALVVGRMRDLPPEERPFSPTLGIIDNWFVSTQTESQFNRAIEANQGTAPRLRDEIAFRLMDSRLGRLQGRRGADDTSAMLTYSDPTKGFRYWLELASNEDNIDKLRDMAEGQPLFKALLGAIDRNGVPPADIVNRYMKPSGSVIYDTPTGFRLIGFEIKGSER